MFQDLSKVRMTVAKAMTECLSAEGISTVFGYPGAAICPFYDELYKTDIRHILVRHEVNGGHAASGYARITGKPAVAVATSGPGALNLITAIATAYMDYRKHGQFEFTAPAILFACLLFSLTAPSYIWSILG